MYRFSKCTQPLDFCPILCHTNSMKNQTTTYILPAELASGFINNDWSILDYIDDAEYTKCVEQFCQQLEYDGLSIVDANVDETSFVKYHDLATYGVLSAECCEFTAM